MQARSFAAVALLAAVLGAALVACGAPRAAREERPALAPRATSARPNVLFLVVDDLNDWVGCLGGHPQARTPNIDRLAASGVLFTNAYAPAVACSPSRAAVLSGIPPHRSGLYGNSQGLRQVLPDAELLPRCFSRQGYRAAGAGKVLHYVIDAPSWDDYFPPAESERPLPRTFSPRVRPLSLPRAPWMYMESDWGALQVSEEEYGGDVLVADWAAAELSREHERPFFLACGIYKPHEPWYVPEPWFARLPADEVQLPPGARPGDLDDVPPEGRHLARNRYLDHIRAQGQWQGGVRAYLAAVAFADEMVGRVLRALDAGPHRDNTIVVLWSDHGFHLGEKEHWQKYTPWRACARVPLIVRVPPGCPGLPPGTAAGGRCSRPVSLVDLYATLLELCGLPRQREVSPRSLIPLLADPAAPWPHAALTHLDQPGDYALSTERWRYIHYGTGGEELYDVQADPYEWTNLAGAPQHAAKLAELRALAPTKLAPRVDGLPSFTGVAPTAELPWTAADAAPAPRSAARGPATLVVFENHTAEPVGLHLIDARGELRTQGILPAGAHRRQTTVAGATWLVTVPGGEELGHFVAEVEPARAAIY